MLKSKLFGLAIASMVGWLYMSPIDAQASETNSESVTLSESSKDQRDTKPPQYEDSLQKAIDKWSTLTNRQKAEVYALLEKEMKAEIKLVNKLVDLGVLDESDANAITTRMQDKLAELKKSGEFPLSRPRHNHDREHK